MQYQINIDIDAAGLSAIYASGQSVTLVKSVVANPLAGGNLPIAWIAFQPLEANAITWIENYYMYATTTVIQSGATIMMTSQTQTPVQEGWTYTFAQGQFGSASGSGKTFNLSNQMTSGNFQFGLAQQANINNVSTLAPLNAVPVLYNENVTFTPEENVSLFLSGVTNNGSVLTQVASNALTVTLTSQAPTVTVGFNDATNSFFLVGAPQQTREQFARRLGGRAAARPQGILLTGNGHAQPGPGQLITR